MPKVMLSLISFQFNASTTHKHKKIFLFHKDDTGLANKSSGLFIKYLVTISTSHTTFLLYKRNKGKKQRVTLDRIVPG